MSTLSQRVETLLPSPVRKYIPYKEAAEAKGIKVFGVHIGDPDFDAPKAVLDSVRDTAKNIKKIPYSTSQGQIDLIEAWRRYYHRLSIPLSQEDVIVTNGASEALSFAGAIVCDPGQELLVFEPYYGIYQPLEHVLGVNLTGVLLDKSKGYRLPPKELVLSKISPNTKAILFTNPNNPTGTVFTKEEIRQLIDIAMEKNIYIISDETYRGLCFDGKESVSILHIASEEEQKRIILIDSVSKRLNVCGVRMGALISKNKDIMSAALKIAQTRISAPYLEQLIMEPTIDNSQEYVSWLRNEYQKRRDKFINTLQTLLDIKIHVPEGAFYAMVQLPVRDTDIFTKWLLTDFTDNNETVMVSPGSGFYVNPNEGKTEIRVAYVLKENDMQRVAELLALGVKKYNNFPVSPKR